MSGGRLAGLDALRGIAALIVMTMHVLMTYKLPLGPFAKGALAVDFFFVLSGFIMARTYETGTALRLSALAFYRKRYMRLWPVMAIGAVLAALALYVRGSQVAEIVLLIGPLLLLLPNPILPDDPYLTNPPAWSITAELFANLCHPLLARLRLPGVAIVFCLSAYIWQRHSSGFPITINPLSRALTGYCLGIITWRVVGDRLAGKPLVAVLGLPLLIMAFGLLQVPNGLFLLFCPALIAAANGMRVGRVADWIGKLSFPLYAVHTPVLLIAMQIGYSPAVAWLACLAAAILTMALVKMSAPQKLPTVAWRRRVAATEVIDRITST